MGNNLVSFDEFVNEGRKLGNRVVDDIKFEILHTAGKNHSMGSENIFRNATDLENISREEILMLFDLLVYNYEKHEKGGVVGIDDLISGKNKSLLKFIEDNIDLLDSFKKSPLESTIRYCFHRYNMDNKSGGYMDDKMLEDAKDEIIEAVVGDIVDFNSKEPVTAPGFKVMKMDLDGNVEMMKMIGPVDTVRDCRDFLLGYLQVYAERFPEYHSYFCYGLPKHPCEIVANEWVTREKGRSMLPDGWDWWKIYVVDMDDRPLTIGGDVYKKSKKHIYNR